MVLDATYTNLLRFDITAKAFVPKTAADNAHRSAPSVLQDLNLKHGHIRRKMHVLQGYLLRIVRDEDWSPTSPPCSYMDEIAIAHTGLPGSSTGLSDPNSVSSTCTWGYYWVRSRIWLWRLSWIWMPLIWRRRSALCVRGTNRLGFKTRSYVVDRGMGETPPLLGCFLVTLHQR